LNFKDIPKSLKEIEKNAKSNMRRRRAVKMKTFVTGLENKSMRENFDPVHRDKVKVSAHSQFM
jgi:hypothetical protein